jgi:hypothetical protein
MNNRKLEKFPPYCRKAMGTSVTCLAILVAAPLASAATQTTKNQITGLLTWHAEQAGFRLSLQQLTPDNVTAMYESMGASPAVVTEIASYCVFGTDARNLAHEPVMYDVANWRAVTPDGVEHKLQSKVDWLKIWKPLGVNYGFSIFPAAQTFQPGDWGEGFTTVKLPPLTKFNLIYTWSENGQTYKNQMDGLQCAPNS